MATTEHHRAVFFFHTKTDRCRSGREHSQLDDISILATGPIFATQMLTSGGDTIYNVTGKSEITKMHRSTYRLELLFQLLRYNQGHERHQSKTV